MPCLADRMTSRSESQGRGQDQAADERCLAGVAQGSNAALKQLYQRYSGLVFGIALKSLSDRVEAEEVVQDVFVKVWRLAARYKAERSSVKGWICLMARSASIDRLRRRASRPRLVGVEDLSFFGTTEEPRSSNADRHEKLAAALGELRDEHRSSLELAFFKGYTQREIAEALGLPEGTVKSFLRRGMIKLRRAFGQEGVGP